MRTHFATHRWSRQRAAEAMAAAGVIAILLALAPATPAAAAGWTIQPTPNPLRATFSTLSAASCTSASACTAVGYYSTSSSASVALIERWNGTAWSIQPAPGASGGDLSGVSCTSATACTAVGYDGAVTLAERWNGTSWSIQPTPNPAGAAGSVLTSVSCTGPSRCTAAGYWHVLIQNFPHYYTLAEGWNGSSWSIQSTANPSSIHNTLAGVSCPPASACIAVGTTAKTLAEQSSGSSWSLQTTPGTATPAGFSGVSCVSTTACAAVGQSNASTLAELWNGATWVITPTPMVTGASSTYLFAVSCTTAITAVCTAVGDYRNSGAGGTLAERWNGSSWSIQPAPSTGGVLAGVSCTTTTSCTAVGDRFNSSGTQVTLAEEYAG